MSHGRVMYFSLVLNRLGSSLTHSHLHHTTEQRHWYVVSLYYYCLYDKHFGDSYLYNRCTLNMDFVLWSFSQHWLFIQKPESLDPRAKYHSLTSGVGANYTQPRQVSN